MKHFSHLNTAVELIQHYRGEMPFSIYLKSFFAKHKKHGSRDRKSIGHLCYSCFRLGKSIQTLSIEERILIGSFLCGRQPDDLLQQLKPDWNAQINSTIDEKTSLLLQENISFSAASIFPWKEALSNGIDHERYCRSFLTQPDLFLRIRPGHEKAVRQKLGDAGIIFTEFSPGTISLPNASKIDAVIQLNKEAVVQDINSQNTGRFISGVPNDKPTFNTRPLKPIDVWDCCAASGGKSILAFDLIDDINLIVSDVRESIIQNLKRRFVNAGITNYKAFIADLTKPLSFKQQASDWVELLPTSDLRQAANSQLPASDFQQDLIILDAPCTGSGTWSRSPEQLVFFNYDSGTAHYSSLQKKIATNAIPFLKKGGRLVYITCSVFKKENEDIVQYIQDNSTLKVERMEMLKGYDKKADTLFAASLIAQ